MAKIAPRKEVKKKTWPRVCFGAAAALVLFALVLYVVYTSRISGEFGDVRSYYGETFDELYELKTLDKEISEPIMAQAEEAFSAICPEEETEKYGLLSRYCTKLESYPRAAQQEHELELLCGGVSGDSGYLWVAYWNRVTDAQGTPVHGSGSEDRRILSRWGIRKLDGQWVVTEILEHP